MLALAVSSGRPPFTLQDIAEQLCIDTLSLWEKLQHLQGLGGKKSKVCMSAMMILKMKVGSAHKVMFAFCTSLRSTRKLEIADVHRDQSKNTAATEEAVHAQELEGDVG